MPTTDKFKRTVPLVDGPDNSDAPANLQTAFENYSKSDGGFIRVASKAEADQIAATVPAGTKWPLFFWDSSVGRPMVKNDSSSPTLDAIGDGVPENSIYVSGQWYEQSGRQTVPSFDWTQSSDNWWATSISIKWPFTPPPGYSFVYQVDQTNGHTFIQSVNHGFTTGATLCRLLNYAHEAPAVKTVIWQLVKVS